MTQNTSHAVMAQRSEPGDSADDFPTPPWATRAMIEHAFPFHPARRGLPSKQTVLEPACGRGYMSRVLEEYFHSVDAIDINNYGSNEVGDFLRSDYGHFSFDWIITNPPFRLAEDFIYHAMPMACQGVAMLVRTSFIESIGRYHRLFSITPPTMVAQYVERVPMVKGRLDRNASTATSYAWLIWEKDAQYRRADVLSLAGDTKLTWIPPSRKRLERDEDYDGGF